MKSTGIEAVFGSEESNTSKIDDGSRCYTVAEMLLNCSQA